jgi:hypothetical protein
MVKLLKRRSSIRPQDSVPRALSRDGTRMMMKTETESTKEAGAGD